MMMAHRLNELDQFNLKRPLLMWIKRGSNDYTQTGTELTIFGWMGE